MGFSSSQLTFIFFGGVGIPPTSKLLGALFQDNPVLLFGRVWAAITIHDPQKNPLSPWSISTHFCWVRFKYHHSSVYLWKPPYHWYCTSLNIKLQYIYIFIYMMYMCFRYIYIYHLYVWYPRISKAEAFTAQSTDSFYAARGVRLQSLEMTRSSACARCDPWKAWHKLCNASFLEGSWSWCCGRFRRWR